MQAKDLLYLAIAITIMIAGWHPSTAEETYRIYNHHFLIRRSHPTKRPTDQTSTPPEEGGEESGSTADVSLTKVEMGDLQFDEEDYYEEYDDIFKGFKLNKEEAEKDYPKYPKKYSHQEEKESKHGSHPRSKAETTTLPTETFLEEVSASPSQRAPPSEVSPTTGKPSTIRMNDPLAMPVTTEGKKTEDPLKIYGMPKELMPIMPGGGSRFDDIEREKIEKKKMSQTKSEEDESAESGGAHEADLLYSSGSLSSFYLCFYSILSFLLLDRVIL